MNEEKCTLTKLYPSVEIRLIVWEKLKEVFKFKFEALIKEASAFRPFLVCPAKYFEEEIKHLFIDEGQQLDSCRYFCRLRKSLIVYFNSQSFGVNSFFSLQNIS